MANYLTSLAYVLLHEGTYVHDPDDPGGETYKGVARKYHPDWPGWARIDAYKTSPKFPGVLDADAQLRRDVEDFYEAEYWVPVCGNVVGNQDLATDMLDMAVHMGVRRTTTYLQRSLNVLNRAGVLWADLTMDGDGGRMTRAALSKYEAVEGPAFLRKALVAQRGAYYVQRCLDHELSEKWVRGWLRRVRF